MYGVLNTMCKYDIYLAPEQYRKQGEQQKRYELNQTGWKKKLTTNQTTKSDNWKGEKSYFLIDAPPASLFRITRQIKTAIKCQLNNICGLNEICTYFVLQTSVMTTRTTHCLKGETFIETYRVWDVYWV